MKLNPLLLSLLMLAHPALSHAEALNCSSLFAQDLNHAQAQELLELSVRPGPQQKVARLKLQNLLGLDELNFVYYISLFEKFRSMGQTSTTYIYSAHEAQPESAKIAYPIGSTQNPKGITSKFGSFQYSDLKAQFTGQHSKKTALWIAKLQAGTGSSMTRGQYFKSRPDMAEKLGLQKNADMVLGAKGTDLLVKVNNPLNPSEQIEVSIAELQLLQAYEMATTDQYAQVILQDIVGPETQNRLNAIWQKKSLIDPRKTYSQVFSENSKLARMKSVFQSHVPALNESQKMSFNRVAPAGHGLFAVNALRSVLHPELLPQTDHKDLIGAIANGEDLNSLPDPVMVDWMVKNQVPIVLVTTEKSSIDKKGGILTMVDDRSTGQQYLKVIDTAEAKAAGQLEHFENVDGIVSTNLTLFNYKVLEEKLRNIPEAELLKIIAPDLVPNFKEQKDKDGVIRKYLQLEGTMGSTIMNLDRYYRKNFGEGLVSIINVDGARRTDFFSPIKSAFDYYMQFHSDLFKINSGDLKLKIQSSKGLPSFSLKDPTTKDQFYADVQNVLESFKETSVRELRNLEVTGQVKLANAVLKGRVTVVNETGHLFDIQALAAKLPRAADGRLLLENKEVRLTRDGQVTIQNLQEKGLGIAYARVATSGSHTDYNKGFTIASLLPVRTQTWVTPRSDNRVNISSSGKTASFEIGKERLQRKWSDYIRGVTFVLNNSSIQKEILGGEKIHITGFDAKIESNIPYGAGISSSAALVTSVFKALRSAYDLKISDLQIARMGQKVENYVGANTGLLDQMTISLLDTDLDSALLINHANMTYEKFNMPKDAEFVILHTGLTHSLTDTHGDRNYATRRAQCEEAARILKVSDLSKIKLSELEQRQAELPSLLYKRAHHVVSENERVQRFVRAATSNDLAAMGKVMSESHISQRDDYDISEKPIDAMVEILKHTPGVYGAQLTGGGFGGAVVFLARKGQGRAIAENIMPQYLMDSSNQGQFKAFIIAPEANKP